jgi:hypothetical protein
MCAEVPLKHILENTQLNFDKRVREKFISASFFVRSDSSHRQNVQRLAELSCGRLTRVYFPPAYRISTVQRYLDKRTPKKQLDKVPLRAKFLLTSYDCILNFLIISMSRWNKTKNITCQGVKSLKLVF